RRAAMQGRGCPRAGAAVSLRRMKTIGMLGGMSWESSAIYYRLLNREVQKRIGGLASARTILHSFDFAEIAPLQRAGGWDEANRRMAEAALGLERAGADIVIMCCNTMHCATPQIEQASRVALLGSKHTMEQDGILLGRLKRRYGLDAIVPEGDDAAEVSRVIYEELVRGQFLDASRDRYRAVISKLAAAGAQGVILGCTELPMLVSPEDSTVPLFDTTTLHAMAAVDLALAV